jgi:putative flippase GtrA
MKNWNWKQWTAFGIVVALLITIVVLHLVQPQITYSFAEVMTFIGTAAGFVAGYLFKRDIKQTQVAGDNSTQVQIANKE